MPEKKSILERRSRKVKCIKAGENVYILEKEKLLRYMATYLGKQEVRMQTQVSLAPKPGFLITIKTFF
jgi:hypothetical protein